jgi:tRNA uridine 5-carboxymethylaminomethyl modification enzyme
MFTSRAEYRILLRQDNADIRLTARGRELGLVADERWSAFNQKLEAIETEQQRLNAMWLTPKNALGRSLAEVHNIELSKECRALDLIKRPEMNYTRLMQLEGIGPGVADTRVAEQVEIQVKYSGYLDRQQAEVDRNRRHDKRIIPADFDYALVRGLSHEVMEKLIKSRPETVGQAGRIAGVTPAAISLLLVHLKRHTKAA